MIELNLTVDARPASVAAAFALLLGGFRPSSDTVRRTHSRIGDHR